jgi:hypothetical protein
MKEFYLRRIERAKRTRLRVTEEGSVATVFIVIYYQPEKSDLPGTWSLDDKVFNLANTNQANDYREFIKGFEKCAKSEYRFAFAEANKANRHLDSSPQVFEMVKNDQSKEPTNSEYPIPAKIIVKKIEAFMRSSATK